MGSQGHTTVDFGAFPGSSHATVDVTGQAGILTSSDVEAWIRAEDSADHTADEHIVETIQARAAGIIAGTGFRIHAWNTSQLNEPVPETAAVTSGAARGGGGLQHPSNPNDLGGGKGTRLYGVWNVSWVWN